MLTATLVTGVLNYLSNVLVGRLLGPAEYGVFAALISLLLILGVPTTTVQTVATNYVARMRAGGASAQIGAWTAHLVRSLLLWGIGAALALSLLSGPAAAVLHLPSRWPVVVLALVLVPTAVLPVVQGALGGLQRFGGLGATQVGGSILRLATTVGLIALGLGSVGALSSLSLSSLGAFGFGLFFLSDVLRRREPRVTFPLEGLPRYAVHAAIAALAFTLLTNSDVILVKGRFSPTDAGLYSAIATLGKISLWLAAAVVTLLLPKASERQARGEAASGLLVRTLVIVALLCGSMALLFALFPSLIVGALFGDPYLAQAGLLGWYGLAMTFYALTNAWLIYHLATQQLGYSYVLIGAACLQVALLCALPPTMTAVISVLIAIGTALFLAGFFPLIRPASASKGKR